MGRTFYCHKSHQTRHIQVDNRGWKRSQQHMAHQSTKKILRVKITQGRIYVQATSISMLMINKEEVPQQHMAHRPTKKILRMKTTQGRIHVQTTRDQHS